MSELQLILIKPEAFGDDSIPTRRTFQCVDGTGHFCNFIDISAIRAVPFTSCAV
jgi:hypothetical protein